MKRVLFALGAFFAAISMSFAAVDVNKATAAELDSIKGIGPAISKKIVDERAKGAFKDWADLESRVKGIGEKSASAMSLAGLTVNGNTLTAPAKANTKLDAKVKTKAIDTKVIDTKAVTTAVVKETPKVDTKTSDIKSDVASAKSVEVKVDAKAEKKAKKEATKQAKAELELKAAEAKKVKPDTEVVAKISDKK